MNDVSRRDKRRTFVAVAGIGLALAVIAAPLASATHTRSHVGTVKIKSSTGGNILSKQVGDAGGACPAGQVCNGITPVPGSKGAVDVRLFAGGGGVLGAGNCGSPVVANRSVTVPAGEQVTGILFTGAFVPTTPGQQDGPGAMVADARMRVFTTAIQADFDGPGPDPAEPVNLLDFHVDDQQRNIGLSLPNGIGTTHPLTFACSGTANETAAGAGKFVILGQ